MPQGPEYSVPVEPASEELVPAPAAPTPPVSQRSAEQTARAARLAAALRDNLRRRKATKRPAATNGN